MLSEYNTWQHKCKVMILTSSAKEEKYEVVERQHMVVTMTSSKGKLQRKPNEKDGDVIYSKPRFRIRKEKDNAF